MSNHLTSALHLTDTAMAAEAKTRPTTASVSAFLKESAKGDRLADFTTLVEMMASATGEPAVMWGSAIVGFGSYDLAYADGRVADWPVVAFSPRATSIVLYMARNFPTYDALMAKLGKHKQSGGCLHIKTLGDVDVATLKKLVVASVKAQRKSTTG